MLSAVARIWRVRERVEREASDLFRRAAVDLRAIYANTAVIAMAERAAADELAHARLCRTIVDTYEPGLSAQAPALDLRLGPEGLTRRQRTLYAAVAISCVTESLSAALLFEMRQAAGPAIIRATAQHILRDEIVHSRLGWAHLAWEAERGDVSWLAQHVPGMLRQAIDGDVAPLCDADLGEYGILPAQTSQRVVASAIADVIIPGLQRYGIEVGELAPAHVPITDNE